MNLEKIKGSIPPVITPFRGNDVDYDAYAVLIDRQVSEGSHGVLVNGTTAEPSTLTIEERNKLVDIAIEVRIWRNGKATIIVSNNCRVSINH